MREFIVLDYIETTPQYISKDILRNLPGNEHANNSVLKKVCFSQL